MADPWVPKLEKKSIFFLYYQNENEPHALSSHFVNQGRKSIKLWVQNKVQLTFHVVNVSVLHILRETKKILSCHILNSEHFLSSHNGQHGTLCQCSLIELTNIYNIRFTESNARVSRSGKRNCTFCTSNVFFFTWNAFPESNTAKYYLKYNVIPIFNYGTEVLVFVRTEQRLVQQLCNLQRNQLLMN